MFNLKKNTGLTGVAAVLFAAGTTGCNKTEEANIIDKGLSGDNTELVERFDHPDSLSVESANGGPDLIVCNQDTFSYAGFDYKINLGDSYCTPNPDMSRIEMANTKASLVFSGLKDKGFVEGIKYGLKGDNLSVALNKGTEREIRFVIDISRMSPEDIGVNIVNEALENIAVSNGIPTEPAKEVMEVVDRFKKLMELAKDVVSIDMKGNTGGMTPTYLEAHKAYSTVLREVQSSPVTSPGFVFMLTGHILDKRFTANLGNEYYHMTSSDFRSKMEGNQRFAGVEMQNGQLLDSLVVNFHRVYNGTAETSGENLIKTASNKKEDEKTNR